MRKSTIDSERLQIQKKVEKRKKDNLSASINYLEAITTLGDMVLKARQNKESEALRTMAKAIQDIAFYVNDLEMERENLYLNTRNIYFI